jgi:hypothetical protein
LIEETESDRRKQEKWKHKRPEVTGENIVTYETGIDRREIIRDISDRW